MYFSVKNPEPVKNLEIERKFLVNKGVWNALEKPMGVRYLQGYLCIDSEKTIRVRLAGDCGFLTIKGRSDTFSHPEFEYSVPRDEAAELILKFTPHPVEKLRYRIPAGEHVFEVDEFHGKNGGLIIAEIELNSPDESFEKPSWLAEEVTAEERYYNANLSLHPYEEWSK